MEPLKHVNPKLAVTAVAVVIVLALAVPGRHEAVAAWHCYFLAVRAVWTWLTAVLS